MVAVVPDMLQVAEIGVAGGAETWSMLGKHRYFVNVLASLKVQDFDAAIEHFPAH